MRITYKMTRDKKKLNNGTFYVHCMINKYLFQIAVMHMLNNTVFPCILVYAFTVFPRLLIHVYCIPTYIGDCVLLIPYSPSLTHTRAHARTHTRTCLNCVDLVLVSPPLPPWRTVHILACATLRHVLL
jgi:hypothetical protein